MAGRSILYLGDSEFAAGFCNKLQAYACCGELERHTELALPDGAYRIRARVSDDRQNVVGDRAFDLTVVKGVVQAGFQPLETEEN